MMTGDSIHPEFGPNLARHRLARGWSQEHAARQAGVGLATLQRVEGGSGCYLSTVIALAAAYETTIDALLHEEPPS